MQITAPGLYPMDAEVYHADPVVVPSLSSGIAKLLIRQTPMHAHAAHPRFGASDFTPTSVMDDGSAVHAMFAGQSDMIEVIRTTYGPKTKNKDLIGKPVRDYKTAAAQEEREEIREMGKIPVLAHRLPELVACYRAIVRQLQRAEDGDVFLSPGRPEIAAFSCENGVWLRALVDRLPDDPKLPPGDFKLTEMSAAPGGWERRLQTEYAFQDAFYRRVLRGAEGFSRPPMRFGVGELNPPHGTVIMAAAPQLQALAEAEVERAIRIWRHCIERNEWPGYPHYTAWVDPTPWQMREAEATELRHEIMEMTP